MPLMLLAMLLPGNAHADASDAYNQAVVMASSGQSKSATVAMATLAAALPAEDIWHQRAVAAWALLSMRTQRQTELPPLGQANANLTLATAYAATNPLLPEATSWPATALAVAVPGAGHAWLGRFPWTRWHRPI